MITQKSVLSLRVWFGNPLTLVEQKLELRWKKRPPPTFAIGTPLTILTAGFNQTPTFSNQARPDCQPDPASTLTRPVGCGRVFVLYFRQYLDRERFPITRIDRAGGVPRPDRLQSNGRPGTISWPAVCFRMRGVSTPRTGTPPHARSEYSGACPAPAPPCDAGGGCTT